MLQNQSPATGEPISVDAHKEAVVQAIFGEETGFPGWLKSAANELATRYSSVQTTAEFNTALRSFSGDGNKPFELFVVGEGNFGKSTLVNAFLGQELSKVHFLPETRSFLRFVASETPTTQAKLFARIQPGIHDWLKEKLGQGIASEELYEIEEFRLPRNAADQCLAEEAALFKQSKNEYPLAIYEYETVFKYSPRCVFPPSLRLVDTQGLNQMFPKELLDASEKLDSKTSSQRFQDWLEATSRGRHLEWQFRRCDAVLWLAHARKSNSAATLTALRYFKKYGKTTVLAVTNVDRIQGGAAEQRKVLDKIRETYGAYVSRIIPVNGKQALESVLKENGAAMKESGFEVLSRYLTDTCIEDGNLIRKVGRYNSMRISEQQLRNALIIQKTEYKGCIDLLVKHRQWVSHVKDSNHEAMETRIGEQSRKCLVAFGSKAQSLTLEDDGTSAERVMRPREVSDMLSLECDNIAADVTDNAKSLAAEMVKEPYRLPTFDAEGMRAADGVTVSIQMKHKKPNIQMGTFSIELEKASFLSRVAFDAAEIFGGIPLLGKITEAAREKKAQMLSERRTLVLNQVKQYWQNHFQRALDTMSLVVDDQFQQILFSLEAIEKELERQEGNTLESTVRNLEHVTSDCAVKPIIPLMLLNIMRKRFGPAGRLPVAKSAINATVTPTSSSKMMEFASGTLPSIEQPEPADDAPMVDTASPLSWLRWRAKNIGSWLNMSVAGIKVWGWILLTSIVLIVGVGAVLATEKNSSEAPSSVSNTNQSAPANSTPSPDAKSKSATHLSIPATPGRLREARFTKKDTSASQEPVPVEESDVNTTLSNIPGWQKGNRWVYRSERLAPDSSIDEGGYHDFFLVREVKSSRLSGDKLRVSLTRFGGIRNKANVKYEIDRECIIQKRNRIEKTVWCRGDASRKTLYVAGRSVDAWRSEQDDLVVWYTPEIGFVKWTVNLQPSGRTVTNTLVGYKVGSQMHGDWSHEPLVCNWQRVGSFKNIGKSISELENQSGPEFELVNVYGLDRNSTTYINFRLKSPNSWYKASLLTDGTLSAFGFSSQSGPIHWAKGIEGQAIWMKSFYNQNDESELIVVGTTHNEIFSYYLYRLLDSNVQWMDLVTEYAIGSQYDFHLMADHEKCYGRLWQKRGKEIRTADLGYNWSNQFAKRLRGTLTYR